MAICKHNSSKNGFAAPLEYLTMQHDSKGRLLRGEDGAPLPREEYLIDGVNCLPETFAPLCLQDRLRFKKAANRNTVDTHQYIISFAPSDAANGLTMEKAHKFALDFARKNFEGHRILVCTHPDGSHHSGNIHVHIIVSSLRFQNRTPDAQFMKLSSDGSVRLFEYRAGYAHQDTAALRQHLLSRINRYCASHGYVLCPEKGAEKISQKEYRLKERGFETRNDQLRRAIADAAATTNPWEEFVDKLHNAYTHPVPVISPIPYGDRQNLWKAYKKLSRHFWSWDKQLRASLQQQLEDAFQEISTCKSRSQKKVLRERVHALKQEQAQERLFRQTWQAYSKAASLALKSQNQEDALLCLEQMQELADRHNGCWQEGWLQNSDTYSLLDGSVKSQITWKQITRTDFDTAQKILQAVQEENQQRKPLLSEVREESMPIEVKLTRGVISFRHPDSGHWIRGKRLGEAFTLSALGIALPNSCIQRQRSHPFSPEYSR